MRESIIVALTSELGIPVKFCCYTFCGILNSFMKAMKFGYYKQGHMRDFVKHLRWGFWRKYLST